MKKKQSNIYETKTNLSKIVAQVQETGEAYTICKNGKPVADIVVHGKRAKRDPLKQHPDLVGKAKYLCDPCAPATEEMWPSEYR